MCTAGKWNCKEGCYSSEEFSTAHRLTIPLSKKTLARRYTTSNTGVSPDDIKNQVTTSESAKVRNVGMSLTSQTARTYFLMAAPHNNMVFQQLTPQELSTVLTIAILLGVIRYFRYDVSGGHSVIDITFSIGLAFVTAIIGLLIAKRLGWLPTNTHR